MREEIKKAVKETVPVAVKVSVNGKIDDLQQQVGELRVEVSEHIVEHKADTEALKGILTDVAPIIQEFKEQKAVSEGFKSLGDKVINWSKVAIAIGVIIGVVKLSLMWLIQKQP